MDTGFLNSEPLPHLVAAEFDELGRLEWVEGRRAALRQHPDWNAHLAECARCALELAELRVVLGLEPGVPLQPVARARLDEIAASFRSERPPARRWPTVEVRWTAGLLDAVVFHSLQRGGSAATLLRTKSGGADTSTDDQPATTLVSAEATDQDLQVTVRATSGGATELTLLRPSDPDSLPNGWSVRVRHGDREYGPALTRGQGRAVLSDLPYAELVAASLDVEVIAEPGRPARR